MALLSLANVLSDSPVLISVACALFRGKVGLLVSTYVVCERLSVMHEPAGVVENLVQILQFTPILQYRIPPSPRK